MYTLNESQHLEHSTTAMECQLRSKIGHILDAFPQLERLKTRFLNNETTIFHPIYKPEFPKFDGTSSTDWITAAPPKC